MTLDQLLAFDAIVSTGTFRGAAEKLHKAQSAVSHQVRKLEDEMQLQLFSRDSYRPTLTSQGMVFYRETARVLEAVRTLESTAPALIYEEASLVKRAIRDLYARDVEQVLVEVLSRPARRGPDAIVELFAKVRARRKLSDETVAKISAAIGAGFARAHRPEAVDWLLQAPFESLDEVDRAWLIMSQIRFGAWNGALRSLDALKSPGDADELRWRYWRARVLGKLGRGDEARKIYRALAAERDYYGFMAANRLGVDYAFNDRPLGVPEAKVDALASGC